MRKIIPVIAAGVTTLALAGSAFGYTVLDKDVTLAVDGAETQVSTLSGTVGGVLAEEGIEVGAHDVVAPAVDSTLSDGTRIAVQYGRQVTVNVDGKEQTYWTTARQVGNALTSLGIDQPDADLSTSRSSSIGRQGLTLDIDTMKSVTITDAGKKRVIETTGQTVADALAEAKITVDADDKVTPKKTAAVTDGSAVVYTKVDVTKTTKKTSVDFATDTRNTKELYKGTTKTKRAGKKGTRTTTYQVVKHNGKQKSSKKVDSKVTKKPVTQVILVGTKERPAPKPQHSTTSSSGSNKSSSGSSKRAPAVASGSVWDRLAQCESGGNWSINTGNGFYGGLQFTLSTWRGYGGTGMPHQASRAQQISVAQRVQAGQGWGAWPACTQKLGIR